MELRRQFGQKSPKSTTRVRPVTAYDGGTDSPTSEQYYEMFFANGYAERMQADAALIGSEWMQDADWIDHALAFGYGFSDAATLGIARGVGWALGHERGLHEDTDVAYGIGVATPIVIVGGGVVALPAAPGSTTTLIGTTPLIGGAAGGATVGSVVTTGKFLPEGHSVIGWIHNGRVVIQGLANSSHAELGMQAGLIVGGRPVAGAIPFTVIKEGGVINVLGSLNFGGLLAIPSEAIALLQTLFR